MGLWDDFKGFVGDAKDAVVDVFDGDDGPREQPKPKAPPRMPERGNFQTIIDEANPQGEDAKRPLWMTGGNASGLQNTWNNDFMERFQKQQAEAIEKNEYTSWFDRKDATGIVLADFTTKGGLEVKAGQVFDNGKVVDLEERYGKEGRNQLLSQVLFDPKTLQQIYEDKDVPARLGREVDAVLQANTQQVAAAKTQEDFQEDVDEIKDDPGISTAGIISSALGGGAAGAGAGSFFGGVGAIPGAIAGAGSGIAAYMLNRDDANEQLARSRAMFEEAAKQGVGQALVTGASQFGQQTLRVINPINEAYKGAFDKERGDGEADYYERAEDNPWVKAGNFVTLGAGSIPSVAGLGLKAYLGGIGSATAGGVGELVTGQRFDYNTGKFEDIHDSPGRFAAAAGSTAIDALQLGMGVGLGRITGSLGKTRTEDISGIAFRRDAEGNLIEGGHRAGITSLVPSDFITSAVARYDARQAALKASGYRSNAYSTEQLYTAASALANSTHAGKAALVTGFAEGAEEGVQAVLDEAQFGRMASFETVRDAFLSGTAMGAGMGIGRNIATRGQRQMMMAYAENGFQALTGRRPTEEEKASWKENPEELQYYARADENVTKAMEDLVARTAYEIESTTPAGVAVTAKAQALVSEMVETERKKSGVQQQKSWRAQANTGATNAQRNAVGTPNRGMSDEAQEMHLADIVQVFANAQAGRIQAVKNLKRQVERGEAEIAQTADDAPDKKQRLAEIKDSLQLRELAAAPQDDLLKFLQAMLAQIEGPQTNKKGQPLSPEAAARQRERLIQQVNEHLEAAYFSGVMPPGTKGNYDPEAVRFAATLLTHRSPDDNVASVQSYVPRVSLSAMVHGDRGFSQNSPFAATGHTADYDGDNMLNDGSIILSRTAFRDMRAGKFDVAADTQTLITAVSQVYQISAAEKARASSGDLRTLVEGVVEKLGTTYATRYGMTARERTTLRTKLEDVFFSNISDTPLEDVVEAVRSTAGEKMFQYGMDNWTRETIVAPHIAVAAMEDILTAYNVQAALVSKPEVNEDEAKAGTQRSVGTKHISQVTNQRAHQGPLGLIDVMGFTGASTYLRLHQILWNYQGNTNDAVQDVDAYNLVIEQNAKAMRRAAAMTVDTVIEQLHETSIAEAVYDLVRTSLVNTEAVKEPTPAQVVTAMMQSTNVLRPEAQTWEGTQDTRYNTTLLQAALQVVVEQVEAKGREFLDQNKELRAKVARLRSLATNRDKTFEAIAEVLSGIQLHTLGLGDALPYLPVSQGGTFGTLIRNLESKTQAERRIIVEESRNSSSYDRHRKYSGYELAEAVSNNEASMYQLVLDTAKAVADSRIEVQPDGKITGSLAAQSQQQSENIRTTNRRMRELLRQYLGGRTPTNQNVMELLDTYQAELSPVIEAMLREGGISSLARDGENGLNIRNWFPAVMGAMGADGKVANEEQAEMILLRNSIAAELHKHDVKTAGQKDAERIAGIKDAWVRAYYMLGRSEPAMAREMRRLLLSETSVESWQQKTNALLGTHTHGMPVLAWNRSIDTFEADKPKGGWGAAPTSTQAAWLDAVRALDRLAAADTTESRMATDASVRGKLSAALKNPASRVNSFEYKNFERLAKTAALGLRTRIMTNGSRMQSLIELLTEPSKQGQTKGNAAAAILNWAPIEAEQATLSGRTVPFLQILRFSGAVDISDVMADPSLLITAAVVKDHDGSTIDIPNWFTPHIDADGRVTVEPNVEALLESVNDKALYPLMMKLLLPQTSSFTSTGVEQTGWMYGSTLDANLGKDIQDDAITNPQVFGSFVSHMAQMNDPDDVALFESRVVAIALRDILARDTTASPSAVLAALRSAEERLSRAMLTGAALNIGSQQNPDEIQVKIRTLKQERVARANKALREGAEREGTLRQGDSPIATTGGLHPQLAQRIRDLFDEYVPKILAMQRLPQELRDLTSQVADLAQAGDIDGAVALQDQEQVDERIQDWMENNNDPFVHLFKQLRAVQDAGLLGALYAKYDLENSMDTALPLLADYVAEHPALLSAVTSKRSDLESVIKRIQRNADAGPKVSRTLGLLQAYKPKTLQLLARFVIADEMRQAYDPMVPAATPLHPIPEKGNKSAAFYDPSGAAMVDWVLNPNDPLMKAAIPHVEEAGFNMSLEPDRDLAGIFSGDGGMWTMAMGHAPEIIRGVFGSASVPQVVSSFSGDTPKDARVLEATGRTRREGLAVPQGRTEAVVTKVDGALKVSAPLLGTHTLDGMFFTNASAQGNWGREYMVDGGWTEHPVLSMDLIDDQLAEGQSVTFEVIPPWAKEQPSDVNNVYSDGIPPTELRNGDSQMTSAAARLFFAAQGINQKAQRKAMDAIKSAIAAHTQLPARRITLPDNKKLLSNQFMLHDFFADLADLATEIDLGSGSLGPRFHRDTYKIATQHYVVVATDLNGNDSYLTPQEWMRVQVQAMDAGTTPAEQYASVALLPQSPRELEMLYGFVGPKSLSGPLNVVDARSLSPRLSEVSDEQKQRLSEAARGETTPLRETALARRAWTQPVVPMRAGYHGVDVSLAQAVDLDQQRIAHRSFVHSEREAIKLKGQWDPAKAQDAYKAAVLSALENNDSIEGTASAALGGPVSTTRRGEPIETRAAQEARLVLRPYADGELKTGQLTTGDLERELKKLGAASGDVVAVIINSADTQRNGFEETMRRAFETLASTGIAIQLIVAPDVRLQVRDLMPSLQGYAPVPDTPTLWAPRQSIYSSQTRRAQESALRETFATTANGKLLTLTLDIGSSQAMAINENGGLLGPDATHVHFAVHGAIDIESPLVNWSSPHPDEEQEFIDYLLNNKSEVLKHLQRLASASKLPMSAEKMSLEDAFENLMERAQGGRVTKAPGQHQTEGQINVAMRSRGDGQKPMVLFTFEGAVHPDSQDEFQQQLDAPSDLDYPIAVWSNENDPDHTTFSGYIEKVFATDSSGRRRMIVVTPLQAVANKLSRLGTAYKIEPRRSDSVTERRMKGKATFGDHPIALITGPDDSSSKYLNNGDSTSTQRLLEITGIDLVPTFRRALGLTNSKVSDQMILRNIQRATYDIRAEAVDVATTLSAMNDTIAQKLLNAVGLSFPGATQMPILSPEMKLLTAAMLYVAVEGGKIETIAQIPSAVRESSLAPGQVGVSPPALFTQVIDSDMQLRKYIAGVLNANTDIARSGWNIDPVDYSIFRNDIIDPDVVDENGVPLPMQIRGTLSWGPWTARGEQAEKQTGFASDKSGTSFHNDAFFRAALGEGLATLMDQEALQDSVDKLAELPDWSELSYLPYKLSSDQNKPIKLWDQLTANEVEYRNEVRRILNRYFRRVNGTFSPRAQELRDEAYDIAGLSVSKEEFYEHFDYWIRMSRGNRGVEASSAENDKLSENDIEVAAESIRDKLKRGLPPTYDAVVRLPIQELRWFYSNGGRIRSYTDEAVPASLHNIEYAQGWKNTVDSAMGWSFEGHQQFWSEFLPENDAVLHGYADETETALGLPSSMDSRVAHELVLNGYDRVLSLDPTVNTRLQDSAFHERANGRPLLEVGGQAVQDALREREVTQQLHDAINERLSTWHRSSGAPRPRQHSLEKQRKDGTQIHGSNAKAAAFIRPILGTSFVMRAFVPALPVAGLLEATARKSVWNMADLASGQAYTGFLGRMQNRLLNNDRLSPIVAGLGFTPQLTPNQGRKVELWSQNEGELADFRMHLLGDINYHYDISQSGKILPKMEKFVSLMQDFGRGVRGKKMAQVYIKHYMAVMANNDQDIDIVLASMKNPMWLLGQDGEMTVPAPLRQRAHAAGIYALSSLRGTAPTSLSLASDALIKPLTTSSNTGVNIAGNMLLQLPLMFRQYAANIAVTLPGLQGFDMLAGVFMGGRHKKLLGRFQQAAMGEQLSDKDWYTDTSSVVDPNDIFDMFIRGGVTWTGLFMGATMFGGLGLTGEDDETKRRRKLATLQGTPLARDPRELENDFRNADAIFLDWLPGIGQYFQQLDANGQPTEAIAKPHWMLKAFLDPVLGIERWAETGDIRQVGWGFQSAFTSFPLINGSMLRDANETFRELTSAGLQAASESDREQDQLAGMSLLSNAVWYYQKMLMENSFVNALYTGLDEYDRDPYVLPMRDSDGTIQRDTQLNPRKTDALTHFVDDEGKVQQGYVTQGETKAELRSMTENRFSLALVSNLFSNLMGNGESFMRQDMAVKVRKYDRPEFSQAQSEAALLALFVNADGYKQNLKSETATTEQNARIQQGMLLSFLDEDGDEILSKEGALAVFNGLRAGAVDLNDESLQNIYIDYPTRIEIQKDWMERLVQQGIDLGLSKDRALYRAKSVWNGPSDGSAVGFADILWNDKIPYSKTVGYQQLNTTYIMGPDGMPWATGFQRMKLLGALGLAPLSSARLESSLGVDGRLNSVDPVVGINTGQRGLKRFETSLNVPTDAEIGQSIVDAIEDLKNSDFRQGGYGGYGGYGYRRRGYGGGGGGGYAQRPVNTYAELPRWYDKNFNPIVLRTPYANDVYGARMDNIRTDFSGIRRERISSERGRLTQWQ